jgi:exopolysaccharide production protein ExoQ
MPPLLAFALCSVFVIWIVRISERGTPRSSPGLWIATIYMFYCASRPLANWVHGESGGTIEEGSAIDRLFLVIIIVISLVILNKRRFDWTGFCRNNSFLILLVAFLAVSIVWSDYPGISFKRWVRFCGTPLVALVVITEADPQDAVEKIIRRTAYVLIPFSLVAIKYIPHVGVLYNKWSGQLMWVGVASQKNGLGRLTLISALFLVWVIKRAWPLRKSKGVKRRMIIDGVILTMTLYLMRGPGGAYSATSIAAFLLGVVVYCGLWFARSRQMTLPFGILAVPIAAIVLLGIALPIIGGADLFGLVEMLGRNATFSDRTQIWGLILPEAMKHPIFGCGYGSFWINPPQWLTRINEAHNGYLDVFVEVGIIGVSLVLAFLLSSLRKAYRALPYHFEWGAFSLCFLLLMLAHNITETSFLRPNSHMATVMFLLVLLLSRTETVAIMPLEQRDKAAMPDDEGEFTTPGFARPAIRNW